MRQASRRGRLAEVTCSIHQPVSYDGVRAFLVASEGGPQAAGGEPRGDLPPTWLWTVRCADSGVAEAPQVLQ